MTQRDLDVHYTRVLTGTWTPTAGRDVRRVCVDISALTICVQLGVREVLEKTRQSKVRMLMFNFMFEAVKWF